MSRIDEIEKQIELLNAEKQKLLQEKKENLLVQNWKDLQNKITNLTDNQILFEYLNNTTKTIHLFDKFNNQKKEFLSLGFTHFSYWTKGILAPWKEYVPVSLILIKHWNAIRRIARTLTISELKKYSQQEASSVTSHNKSLKTLFEEINGTPRIEFEESMKNTGYFKQKYYALSNPISIGAQLSKNREGYGNIYNGEKLVYEGTKYGETTEFLIVGISVGACEDLFFEKGSI